MQGVSLEGRLNYDRRLQLEAVMTVQQSLFDTAIEAIDGLPAVRRFLRTPDRYGFMTLSILPEGRLNTDLTAVYTSSMLLAHLAGAPERTEDGFVTTPAFTEVGFKTTYDVSRATSSHRIQVLAGVRNLLNAYQTDFDSGKNRDSNYVYGPSLPRTVYFGIKLGSR